MQRKSAIFFVDPERADEYKRRTLNWASQFSVLLFLDNNRYRGPNHSFEFLMAAESVQMFDSRQALTITDVHVAHERERDWLFGHIAYDYKNALEPRLRSNRPDPFGFPDWHFFRPRTVVSLNIPRTILTVESFEDPVAIYKQIMRTDPGIPDSALPAVSFQKKMDQEQYYAVIDALREHIAAGDCYEINYCLESFCEKVSLDPLGVFGALNKLSPAPHAAYYRLNHLYMMGASPERYIRRKGFDILSQPIKGTARRDPDPARDEIIKEELANNPKEKAENAIIVDLVRNDLARCSIPGSVSVLENAQVRSFPGVHQLISTICASIGYDTGFDEVINATFPMGSMTGAPKIKVMELVEQYEKSRRGLYSGAVGYIGPTSDFDFNVVIRSLFYNESSQYLSYHTGGAITWDSQPLQEWEELLTKAWAMEKIFNE